MKPKQKPNSRNNKEYKIEAIHNNKVDKKEIANQLLRLFYIIFGKSYPKPENIVESILKIMHLCKIINIFYQNHWNKLPAIILLINSTFLILKPLTKLFDETLKQKQD